MSLFTFELDSQIKISAYRFYQQDTYEGGLAIGRHSDERVKRKVEILDRLTQCILHTPVSVLFPEDLGAGARGWCLPFYSCITWFISQPVKDASRHGSCLATIHFQDVTHPYFTPENEKILKAICWKDLAEDFDY